MTILIEPAPELEEAITRAARRAGVTREEFILSAAAEKARDESFANHGTDEVKDIPREFPPGATYRGILIDGNPLAALFAQWEADDPVTSPEDLAERTREGDAITAAIRANRFNIPRDPRIVAIVDDMTEWDLRAKQAGGEFNESNGTCISLRRMPSF